MVGAEVSGNPLETRLPPLMQGEPPVFIVGPGRTGSTLLRSLLSAHSRMVVTPETHFMANAEAWGLASGAPSNFEAFWNRYTSGIRFRDLGVDAQRCRELIGKPRVGEKTPGHARFLPYLLRWFPEARIIVTQRDPRAVVASQMHTHYVSSRITPPSLRDGLVAGTRAQQIAWHARHWTRVFEEWLAPWRDDPRLHTVVYEALVQDPEAELRAICRFLGEDYEPGMLAARSAATVPMPAGRFDDGQMEQWRREHNEKTLSAISPGSVEKWRKELSPSELSMVEGCCERTMRAAGYVPVAARPRRAAGRLIAASLVAAATTEAKGRRLLLGPPTRPLRRRARSVLAELGAAGVARGFPSAWVGYRWMQRETLTAYLARRGSMGGPGWCETVHVEDTARNPLPCNVATRDALPADRGWWGYSFHDVPARRSGPTRIATVPDCLVTWYRDPEKANDFYPAVVTGKSWALDLRELRFRPLHAEALRRSGRPVALKSATWIIERVYHNHSHWLTAHLPKLLLLRERDMLGDVLLPPERTPVMDASLRMLGLEPEQFRTFDMGRPLRVERLTLLETDRFRPELLRLVPQAYGVLDAAPPRRRLFISRAKATRRRLVNEDEIWPLLQAAGFERVSMEDLTFEAQVALMRETAILFAPHGAGLTNMMFCPPGAHVAEIADLSFPNPNFYALAAAMGHHYWLLPAKSLGDLRPIDKNLWIDPAAVRSLLPQLIERLEAGERAPAAF